MKTILICSAAAAALIGGTAALAQAAPQAPMADKIMTRAEVEAKVRDHFAKIDVNRDGVITTDEMGKLRGHMKGRMAMGDGGRRAVMAEQPNIVFDRIDANHDGAISREEFASNRQVRIEKRIVARDGKIAEAGGKRMHGMRGGMGMMAMRMADSNKDGRITLAEAEGAALQHFDMADANHDGQVTREERQQMRQHMRAQRAQNHG